MPGKTRIMARKAATAVRNGQLTRAGEIFDEACQQAGKKTIQLIDDSSIRKVFEEEGVPVTGKIRIIEPPATVGQYK